MLWYQAPECSQQFYNTSISPTTLKSAAEAAYSVNDSLKPEGHNPERPAVYPEGTKGYFTQHYPQYQQYSELHTTDNVDKVSGAPSVTLFKEEDSPSVQPECTPPTLTLPAQQPEYTSPTNTLRHIPPPPYTSHQSSPYSQPSSYTYNTSPQFSTSSQFTAQTSPQFTAQTSPQFTAQTSPQFTTQTSPQFSTNTSPRRQFISESYPQSFQTSFSPSFETRYLQSSPLEYPPSYSDQYPNYPEQLTPPQIAQTPACPHYWTAQHLASIGHFQHFFEFVTQTAFHEDYHNGVQQLWQHCLYSQHALSKRTPVTAVDRHRLRKRFPFPASIWNGESTCYNLKQSSRRILALAFSVDQYPSNDEKKNLAELCEMDYLQICNWFKNRRMREKRQNALNKGQTSNYNISVAIEDLKKLSKEIHSKA